MLSQLAYIQIAIYLFIAPICRSYFDDLHFEYYYYVSFVALASFVFGNLLLKPKKSNIGVVFYPQIRSRRTLFLFALYFFSSLIAYAYELYDRRIGTEQLALLFSAIPPLYLSIFRFSEIIFPLIVASLLCESFQSLNKVKLSNFLLILILIVFFVLSGLVSSRSKLFILAAIVLVLIQNILKQAYYIKFLKISVSISVIYFVVASVLRYDTLVEPTNYMDFLNSDFFSRLDGLELVSILKVNFYNFLFGIRPDLIFHPFLTFIPLGDEALELKAKGMTSIKAIFLSDELSSNFKDYNSFFILDPYYLFGIIGVAISSLFMGFITRYVDSRINTTRSKCFNSLFVAIALNSIILEREFFGILLSLLRDWVFFYICFAFIFKLNPVRNAD